MPFAPFKFNYGEYIFQQLITTAFVQRKLTGILIALMVNFLQIHISSLLCFLLNRGNVYIDYPVQILLSIVLALNNYYLYEFLYRFERDIHMITVYLIDNYTPQQYRIWKRIVVIAGCVYAAIALQFVEITNTVLLVYISQYLICYFIVDQFEQRRIHKFLREYHTRPRLRIFDRDLSNLIDSYYPNRPEKPTIEQLGEVEHIEYSYYPS